MPATAGRGVARVGKTTGEAAGAVASRLVDSCAVGPSRAEAARATVAQERDEAQALARAVQVTAECEEVVTKVEAKVYELARGASVDARFARKLPRLAAAATAIAAASVVTDPKSTGDYLVESLKGVPEAVERTIISATKIQEHALSATRAVESAAVAAVAARVATDVNAAKRAENVALAAHEAVTAAFTAADEEDGELQKQFKLAGLPTHKAYRATHPDRSLSLPKLDAKNFTLGVAREHLDAWHRARVSGTREEQELAAAQLAEDVVDVPTRRVAVKAGFSAVIWEGMKAYQHDDDPTIYTSFVYGMYSLAEEDFSREAF